MYYIFSDQELFEHDSFVQAEILDSLLTEINLLSVENMDLSNLRTFACHVRDIVNSYSSNVKRSDNPFKRSTN